MHAMENCVHPRGTALPRSRRPGAAPACSTTDDPGRLRPARTPTTPAAPPCQDANGHGGRRRRRYATPLPSLPVTCSPPRASPSSRRPPAPSGRRAPSWPIRSATRAHCASPAITPVAGGCGRSSSRDRRRADHPPHSGTARGRTPGGCAATARSPRQSRLLRQTIRHRVNRGGDRQLTAPYTIVLARLKHDPPSAPTPPDARPKARPRARSSAG
jgi:hypothetical protein